MIKSERKINKNKNRFDINQILNTFFQFLSNLKQKLGKNERKVNKNDNSLINFKIKIFLYFFKINQT